MVKLCRPRKSTTNLYIKHVWPTLRVAVTTEEIKARYKMSSVINAAKKAFK